MRSIATVTGSGSVGGPVGSPIDARTSRAARCRDERSTMRESIRPGHDCTASRRSATPTGSSPVRSQLAMPTPRPTLSIADVCHFVADHVFGVRRSLMASASSSSGSPARAGATDGCRSQANVAHRRALAAARRGPPHPRTRRAARAELGSVSHDRRGVPGRRRRSGAARRSLRRPPGRADRARRRPAPAPRAGRASAPGTRPWSATSTGSARPVAP